MRRVPDWADDDEMVTMRPHPASIMSGTAACRQWKVPVRLTAIMRSHASGVMSRNSVKPSIPALVTMISIGPRADRTSSRAVSMAARSLTSTTAAQAVPPDGGDLARRPRQRRRR